MLSIGKAQGGYYVSLAKDDYYTHGGEPNGIWHGRGAEHLGFTGEIDKTEFLKLCDGVGKGNRDLCQNTRKPERVAGWDLTFSAPKSVSVLWSQADQETRAKIQDLHFKAVKSALDYIEAEGGSTRRGHLGAVSEKCKLVFGTFEHGTNRNQEPQLHTHAIALNVAVRDDGTTGTIQSRPIYRLKMSAGALYRAELAHGLANELHLGIEKTKDAFEIKGVSETLIDEFSSRRKEIVNAMKDAGATGAERAAYFTMATREKKEHVPRGELFEKWQSIGRAHGFKTDHLFFGVGDTLNQKLRPEDKEQLIHDAAEKITRTVSYFSAKDLIRHIAQDGVGKLSADDVKTAVSDYLEQSAVKLGRGLDGSLYYTTKEIDALEKRMLSDIQDAKRGWHKEPDIRRETVIRADLNNEQKLALLAISDTGGSSIRVVSGMAGTGKTTLLKSAKEVWEAHGYEVQGVALAGKAAQGLEEGSGIRSDTIHKLLFEIERGNVMLTGRSILVVDEAGMVGTRQMSELVSEVKKAKAQLILVGDERQLQPIEAGNPFKAIGDRVGKSELIDIKRQHDAWAREAVKDFARGDAEKGLRAFAERDLLRVSETRYDAMKDLVSDWSKEKGSKLDQTLMIAGTKAEVSNLNRLAQNSRMSDNELQRKSVEIKGTFIYEGDRVLLTKNNRTLKVRNGDIGTLSEIDRTTRTLKITLDNGNHVKIPLTFYEEIQLGYAVTVHKAQGVTKNRVYVLAGGSMQDRELAYVQMSRSRGETKIYTDRAEVGDTITDLSKQMSRSRMKTLAQDVTITDEKTNLEHLRTR